MTQPQRDWHWLDASETIGIADLSQACGVSIGELQELVDYGAVRPASTHEEQGLFPAGAVVPLRTACKLRRDYDLDLFTVALLVDYLRRIDELEHEVRSLRAHLPAHVAGPQRDAPQPWREPHDAAH